MDYLLFSFFGFGIILAVIGWFFDKASHFPWLMKIVSKNSVNGLNALNLFLQGTQIGILPNHPGFNVILKHWPNLSDKDSVAIIGRGGTVLTVDTQTTSDFDLIAYDSDEKIIEPKWKESSIRKILLKKQESVLFKIGTFVFWIGLIMALVSGLLNFLNGKTSS